MGIVLRKALDQQVLLAPEAGNLTVRNLGHMTREQEPESAPERKDTLQA